MSVITIIGAGLMGSAMSRPATDNQHEVRLVGTPLDRHIIEAVKKGEMHPTLPRKLPESVQAFQIEELETAIDGAELIIGGVSSFGVDWFAESVLPHLKPGVPVLTVTKGMLGYPDGSLQTFPHFFATIRPDISFAAIGGPCTSYELVDRRQTMVCYASESMEAACYARDLLATGYYHVTPTTNVIALECSVAMKNAYAMGVSLAVGMAEQEVGITGAEISAGKCVSGAPDENPVYNPQAALFAQSCLEMRRLVSMLGANPDLVCGVAGAGDLYVTIFGGRTRKLGTLLGRGIPYEKAKELLSHVTLEAVSITTRMAEALRVRAENGKVELKDFPLLMHMDALINGGASINLDWNSFGETGI